MLSAGNVDLKKILSGGVLPTKPAGDAPKVGAEVVVERASARVDTFEQSRQTGITRLASRLVNGLWRDRAAEYAAMIMSGEISLEQVAKDFAASNLPNVHLNEKSEKGVV